MFTNTIPTYHVYVALFDADMDRLSFNMKRLFAYNKQHFVDKFHKEAEPLIEQALRVHGCRLGTLTVSHRSERWRLKHAKAFPFESIDVLDDEYSDENYLRSKLTERDGREMIARGERMDEVVLAVVEGLKTRLFAQAEARPTEWLPPDFPALRRDPPTGKY